MTNLAAREALAGFDGFTPYTPPHRAACLALFDANCPRFFAPNERADYAGFLEGAVSDYWVLLEGDEAVAAFGLISPRTPERLSLTWIMVQPRRQGTGLGRAIMMAIRVRAGAARVIDIAASHLSAPFFARFGARDTGRIADGWGPGMHRVDMELWLDGEPEPIP
ncbi:MAG TPA: GNAT family N-acetyltransferase [Sphingomonas sp.]|nr:GNAT family N-acetyltransferase [Sphingomonas sp.]